MRGRTIGSLDDIRAEYGKVIVAGGYWRRLLAGYWRKAEGGRREGCLPGTQPSARSAERRGEAFAPIGEARLPAELLRLAVGRTAFAPCGTKLSSRRGCT